MDNAGSASRSRTATVQLVGNHTVGYDFLTENSKESCSAIAR